MAYNSQRQAVLAENVALHATPGAKAKDLKTLDFAKMADAASGRLQMARTDSSHQGSPLMKLQESFKVRKDREAFEVTPTQNSISLEEQQKKMARNAMQYQTATNIYMKYTNMLKTVTGNR